MDKAKSKRALWGANESLFKEFAFRDIAKCFITLLFSTASNSSPDHLI
ncbi:MAG: hypothetical protein SRB2_03164 [Desulfobacteraceae bacterium Eth-SRB2]|nr:MAG: hypothetical protein SRB2_03164 [Desulfobacteraceae bacterium Eth-SRB2]